jgi:hypothetical protein
VVLRMSDFFRDPRAFRQELRARPDPGDRCWSCSSPVSLLLVFDVGRDFGTLGQPAQGVGPRVTLCPACAAAYRNSFDRVYGRGGAPSPWTAERVVREHFGSLAGALVAVREGHANRPSQRRHPHVATVIEEWCEMRQYFFCVGGVKLENYLRFHRGPEGLIRGLVYVWRGEEVPDPDNPGESLLVVRRPSLGPAVLGPRSAFIPLGEVADFFDPGEPVLEQTSRASGV